jgi:hypothetical protein
MENPTMSVATQKTRLDLAADLFSADGPNDDFLSFLPDAQRGGLKQRFLCHVRSGMTDPQEIVALVREVLARRTDAAAVAIVRAMDEHPNELLSLVAAVLAHDDLPPAVKQARRSRARADAVSRYMAAAPATYRQRCLLEGLGFSGEVRSRLEASRMIEHLLSQTRQRAEAGDRR